MAGDGASLVYDGDCPFCSQYVRYLRLRDSVGPVQLINARDGGALVDDLRLRGFDLDKGMVLLLDGRCYYGADCINRLALLSTPNTLFNRVNAFLFSSTAVSRIAYPLLRSGRSIALWALGRDRLQ